MSLYADEELGVLPDIDPTAISTVPTDPLQALAAALTCPAESAAQADALIAAGQRFEEHPDKLPELCLQLLPMVVDGGESLLRSWTLEMVALAVGRSDLKVEVKLNVAQSSLDVLNRLLAGSSVSTIKAVIPIFSIMYPIIFRILATSRPLPIILEAFTSSKSRILSFALDPAAQPQSVGIKAAAWKFVQKVLLAGTRATAADPRVKLSRLDGADIQLQTRGGTDPNISMISRDSPFDATELEEEANLLRTQLVTQMYSSRAASFTNPSGRQDFENGYGAPHQLNDALVRQKQRMEIAMNEEQEARKSRRDVKPGLGIGKHMTEAESSAEGAKRARLEVNSSPSQGRGAEVDVTSISVETVIDLVMAGLSAVSVDHLRWNTRRALRESSADAVPLLATSLGVIKAEVTEDLEDEVLNPLDMEMDDEDLLVRGFVSNGLMKAPPLESVERDDLVNIALQRIWSSGAELAVLPDPQPSDEIKLAVQPKEMWMLLLARLATRGTEVKRKPITDFVVSDFARRSKFASIWLNEEWFNEKIGSGGQYNVSLDGILSAYLPTVDARDRSLSSFLSTLPEIPTSVVSMLETLCNDTERSIAGFLALRDLVEARPPVRQQALRILLELCTHTERKTRVMAISTVRRWVPESPMAPTVVNYGLGVLRRLVRSDNTKLDGDTDMEEGEQADEVIESRYLGEVTAETVQQHVELVFALSRRQQELLDDIFRVYPKMEAQVQDSVETLLTPLIQSLGASSKLIEILRIFPPGADRLALRVVTILSADGASPVLVSLVKGLLAERELNPRFIIPIVGQLDKAEIERQIPRIVSLLGTSDSRDLVRTAFASILQKMTPADLLVSLHDEDSGLKATIEAIGICFSMTTVFRSDVLVNALARVADLPTLPVVFLRTVIQAVTTYKSLIPFIANTVLPKLVAKKIWETPQLWDGFMILAKRIAPASYGSLLRLPMPWLKDVIQRQPALKQGLRGFLAGKPQARGALAEIFGDDV
ncbi:MAG: hypothetical protein TREMPRED_003351 [Tremellales sp. Tagirdzhanova-0007]|nr:MAG: hypothetical protein TREMPRED_003351 [Tremellales sp. Tagirdzhanova-0007]